MSFKEFWAKTKNSAVKHSPELLIAAGLIGMASSIILSIKATPKAEAAIAKAKVKVKKEEPAPGVEVLRGAEIVEISKMDTIKVTWKYYIPAMTTFVLSSACIIGSNRISAKREAALAAAYALTERAFKTYKDKVVETIGEKKEKTIMDSIAEDQIKENPPQTTGSQVILGSGKSLCRDAMSGRYFYQDIEKIKRAEIDLNYKMLNEMYISVNDYYEAIGLEETTAGEDLGWCVNNGKLRFVYSPILTEGKDEPCLNIAFDYDCLPKDNYKELY